MIGNSTAEYVWIVTWVVILHSIGPLSACYCLFALCKSRSLLPSNLLECYAFAEAAFYVLTLIYLKFHLQRPAQHPHPTSKEERNRLFNLCLETTEDYEGYLSRWFLNEELSAIKRDNVIEFFSWAFFDTGLPDARINDELEEYVQRLEEKVGTKFPPGRSDAKCIRLTLDDVGALHRSLLWYVCIWIVDLLTHGFLRLQRFTFNRASTMASLSALPPRPHALLASKKSPVQDISYWYRAHTAEKELPIVFLHGIGVGLYPYMEFLKELNQGRPVKDGNIGILAVEILPISSRITTAMLPRKEMCESLRTILDHHKLERFVLVSHSYGSVISTHILKTPELARRVSSVVLIDPISILLNQPDVAYNFTVRKPKLASEWLLWYFGSKDMGVAHTLSRTFFWSENILWKEDLSEHRTVIFLGSKDSIINAPKVLRYLQKPDDPEKEREKTGRPQYRPTVVWCPDLDHGQVFDLPVWRDRLRNAVLMESACRS